MVERQQLSRGEAFRYAHLKKAAISPRGTWSLGTAHELALQPGGALLPSG